MQRKIKVNGTNSNIIEELKSIHMQNKQNIDEADLKVKSGTMIYFGNLANLVYQIVNLDHDFVDWFDAKQSFKFITFVKNNESGKWIKNDAYNGYLNGNFVFCLSLQHKSINVGGIKIFVRHNNYKNISSQKNTELKDIKISDLPKYGFFEMDVKKNCSGNDAYFELLDKSGKHICYADVDPEKISKINDDAKFRDNNNNEFKQKFDISILDSDKVFANGVQGYCCDNTDICYPHIFLGENTSLTFAKELFDGSKNRYLHGSIIENYFCVHLGSTPLKNILDVFFEQKCLPCNCLVFIDDSTINNWDYNKIVDDNLHGKNSVALRISDFTFDEAIKTNNFDSDKNELNESKDGLDFAEKFCKLLSKLKKPDSKFGFDLYTSDDIFIKDVKQINISKQQAGHSIFILNREIKLKFDKSFLDNNNRTTKFYMSKKCQSVKDISDLLNKNAGIEIYFVKDDICILNNEHDTVLEIGEHLLSYLGIGDSIQQVNFMWSLNLSSSEIKLIVDFYNRINLLSEQAIKKRLEKLINSGNINAISMQLEQNIKKYLKELINSDDIKSFADAISMQYVQDIKDRLAKLINSDNIKSFADAILMQLKQDIKERLEDLMNSDNIDPISMQFELRNDRIKTFVDDALMQFKQGIQECLEDLMNGNKITLFAGAISMRLEQNIKKPLEDLMNSDNIKLSADPISVYFQFIDFISVATYLVFSSFVVVCPISNQFKFNIQNIKKYREKLICFDDFISRQPNNDTNDPISMQLKLDIKQLLENLINDMFKLQTCKQLDTIGQKYSICKKIKPAIEYLFPLNPYRGLSQCIIKQFESMRQSLGLEKQKKEEKIETKKEDRQPNQEPQANHENESRY